MRHTRLFTFSNKVDSNIQTIPQVLLIIEQAAAVTHSVGPTLFPTCFIRHFLIKYQQKLKNRDLRCLMIYNYCIYYPSTQYVSILFRCIFELVLMHKFKNTTWRILPLRLATAIGTFSSVVFSTFLHINDESSHSATLEKLNAKTINRATNTSRLV